MKGKVVLFMGPSGSGKGTLLSYIRAEFPELVYPTSWTTRAPRAGEQDGKNTKNGKAYHFVSMEEFIQAKDNGTFIEWDHHFNNYYGTPAKEVAEALAAGKVVLQELEIRGAEQLLKKIPREDITIIFVTASSWEQLSNRVMARESITPDEMEKRYVHFQEETVFANRADYILINEDGKLAETEKRLDEIMRGLLGSSF